MVCLGLEWAQLPEGDWECPKCADKKDAAVRRLLDFEMRRVENDRWASFAINLAVRAVARREMGSYGKGFIEVIQCSFLLPLCSVRSRPTWGGRPDCIASGCIAELLGRRQARTSRAANGPHCCPMGTLLSLMTGRPGSEPRPLPGVQRCTRMIWMCVPLYATLPGDPLGCDPIPASISPVLDSRLPHRL